MNIKSPYQKLRKLYEKVDLINKKSNTKESGAEYKLYEAAFDFPCLNILYQAFELWKFLYINENGVDEFKLFFEDLVKDIDDKNINLSQIKPLINRI